MIEVFTTGGTIEGIDLEKGGQTKGRAKNPIAHFLYLQNLLLIGNIGI